MSHNNDNSGTTTTATLAEQLTDICAPELRMRKPRSTRSISLYPRSAPHDKTRHKTTRRLQWDALWDGQTDRQTDRLDKPLVS